MIITQDQSVFGGSNTSSSGGCTGNEVLCISVPSPITIVVLGVKLQVEIPTIRLTSTT